jgi:chromosome segregation ATPase
VKDPNIPDDNLGSQVAASIKMQNLIGIADDKVALEQQKLADAQAAEIEKGAELKRVEAEQRRMRRERIASDLPLVEAEVLQNQTRLEQLRAEMAKIEAAVQKNLEDKRKLAEEMERLGQEAEDQLQAQKDKLKTLTRQESRSNGGMFSIHYMIYYYKIVPFLSV